MPQTIRVRIRQAIWFLYIRRFLYYTFDFVFIYLLAIVWRVVLVVPPPRGSKLASGAATFGVSGVTDSDPALLETRDLQDNVFSTEVRRWFGEDLGRANTGGWKQLKQTIVSEQMQTSNKETRLKEENMENTTDV